MSDGARGREPRENAVAGARAALGLAITLALVGCDDPTVPSVGVDARPPPSRPDASPPARDARVPAVDAGQVADTSVPAPPPPPPPGDAGPSPAYPPTPADVRAYLEERLARGRTPGAAACIVKAGRVAWCDGFGYAHIAESRVPTPETPFLLASISKTITAVALMSLVEDGALSLDDDVAELVPFGLSHPRSAAPIRERALLTHTAGVLDNWDAIAELYAYPATPDEGADPPYPLGETVRGYFEPGGAWYSERDNFDASGPGSAYAYSNMGIALAAYAGEVVSGTDFAALCDERVIHPLGLARTSFRWRDVAPFGVAMPYSWDGETYVANGHYSFADYPDGGLFASAADLARFELAIIGGGQLDGVRILDEATVAQMLTPQVPAIAPTQGIVFYSSEWEGATWWGHDGAESGVATVMYFRPSDGLGYVLLRNGDGDVDAEAGYEIEAKLVEFAETL